MPTSEIKKDAREGKGTVPSLEKKWDKAKDASKKSTGKDDDWALTNYIYQKERDASVELNATTRLIASSAEETIRQAINEAPHVQLNHPFPIVVHFNGKSLPFLCQIQKLPSAAEQMRGIRSKAYLTTVKWGVLIKGDAPTWIADQYVLDGKNNLKPNGLPKPIDQHEAEQFFHICGVPIPHHSK